jgi:hypothetical protein
MSPEFDYFLSISKSLFYRVERKELCIRFFNNNERKQYVKKLEILNIFGPLRKTPERGKGKKK